MVDDQWTRWRGCARRYFRARLKDPWYVDDLVQETCYRAWQSLEEGRALQIRHTWVLGISWRVLADHYRERRSGTLVRFHPRLAELDGLVDEPRESLVRIGDEHYGLSRALDALDKCVAELPSAWAPVMRDRMRGLSMRELARLHGTSLNVVKLRLHRGRRRLRQALLNRLQKEEEDVVRV